jgi:hypothetical protein
LPAEPIRKALPADQRDKSTGAQRSLLKPQAGGGIDLLAYAAKGGEHVRAAGGDRYHKPTADRELAQEHGGGLGTRRVDRDRLEGRSLGKPAAAVADDHLDVVGPHLGEHLLGGAGELLDPFDRDHLGPELSEDGGRIARARPDL